MEQFQALDRHRLLHIFAENEKTRNDLNDEYIYMGNDLFLHAESKREEMISNSTQVWQLFPKQV